MHITLPFWKSSSFNFMVKFHLWKGEWCPWVLHTCLFLDWEIPETEFRLVLLCQTLCDPMDCNPPGSSVMEFSRQEYWSGLPFPSPRDLPNPGIKPISYISGRFFTVWATREAQISWFQIPILPCWLCEPDS